MKHKLLSTVAFLFSFSTFGQVNPMLSTTWNQGCYYNADCPAVGSGGSCGRVYTGCNATAIAQIFKYYSFPSTGMGNHCNTNNITHCVDFSAQTYNYASMPNNVTSANAEVAKLMYHLGIAVDMQWSGTSSNSYFDIASIKRYFKYSPRMHGVSKFMYTTAELIEAIKAELNAGRPVYAKGGSHFYLIDGYNLSDQFHMNFGWSGTYDGYYNIDNVVNGAGTFTPTNFIFNIKPMDGNLETGMDTIVVSANAGTNQTIEFTSLQNWTMSTNAAWITLNSVSGVAGYYINDSSSYFANLINNGNVRYGYIYISNGSDSDTIVVKQDASSLVVTQNNLTFPEAGGSQNDSISWYSWSTWNAGTSDSWISVSPSSGTGNGTIIITCAPNPDTTARSGIVVVTAGAFRDSIFVQQDASVTTGAFENTELPENILVFPSIFQDRLNLIISKRFDALEIIITNLHGHVFIRKYFQTNETNYEIDVKEFADGFYFMTCRAGDKTYTKKLIKVTAR